MSIYIGRTEKPTNCSIEQKPRIKNHNIVDDETQLFWKHRFRRCIEQEIQGSYYSIKWRARRTGELWEPVFKPDIGGDNKQLESGEWVLFGEFHIQEWGREREVEDGLECWRW